MKNLVDYYGKDELIYLGPDEQVCGMGVLADGAAIVFPVVTCLFSFAGDALGTLIGSAPVRPEEVLTIMWP